MRKPTYIPLAEDGYAVSSSETVSVPKPAYGTVFVSVVRHEEHAINADPYGTLKTVGAFVDNLLSGYAKDNARVQGFELEIDDQQWAAIQDNLLNK